MQSTDPPKPQFKIKKSNESWVMDRTQRRIVPVRIRLKEQHIIGNWGYNAGDVVELDEKHAQVFINNGKAELYVERPKTERTAPELKKKPGWPKGRPRKRL